MTTIPTQARHGPADTNVNGAGSVVHVLAGQAGTDDRRSGSDGLQVWAKTRTTTTRGGGQRQSLIVRCSCGCDHLHFAAVGVTSVIRRAACGLTYLVRCEPGW